MYADPNDIKSEVIRVRVTPRLKRLLEAFAEYNGAQPASIARELIEAALAAELGQLSQKQERA